MRAVRCNQVAEVHEFVQFLVHSWHLIDSIISYQSSEWSQTRVLNHFGWNRQSLNLSSQFKDGTSLDERALNSISSHQNRMWTFIRILELYNQFIFCNLNFWRDRHFMLLAANSPIEESRDVKIRTASTIEHFSNEFRDVTNYAFSGNSPSKTDTKIIY